MRYAIFVMAALPLSVASISLAADGAALFKQNCAGCHGATGHADTPAGKSLKVPALAGDAKVAGMSDADVVAAIKAAKPHASVKASDDDLKAIGKWIQSL